MKIEFPQIDEQFIQAQVARGYYGSEEDLVREAVKRLREKESDPHARLIEALERGEADIRAGRTVPYNQEFLDDCEARARENVAKGIRPNPDVCP